MFSFKNFGLLFRRTTYRSEDLRSAILVSLSLYMCFERIPISVDAFYQFDFLILNAFDSPCTSFIAALFGK